MDLKIFDLLRNPKNYSFGLIKLNSKFAGEGDLNIFSSLWEKAKLRASADGGTNVLYENVVSSRTTSLPTFISGDFDSIQPGIKEFYIKKGVEAIHTPDENETDFTKCLKLLHNKADIMNIKLDFVAVHVGRSTERFDHILGNINTLFKLGPIYKTFLFLIMDDSISFLLHKGGYNIHVDSPLRGKWCSLVPIGGPCQSISTSGLAYNMTEARLAFGELVSTSNDFDGSKVVSVECSSPVLWSMGLNV